MAFLFSFSFSLFFFRLEDFIGLLSWGTLTYYRWLTKLMPVLKSKGGYAASQPNEEN